MEDVASSTLPNAAATDSQLGSMINVFDLPSTQTNFVSKDYVKLYPLQPFGDGLSVLHYKIEQSPLPRVFNLRELYCFVTLSVTKRGPNDTEDQPVTELDNIAPCSHLVNSLWSAVSLTLNEGTIYQSGPNRAVVTQLMGLLSTSAANYASSATLDNTVFSETPDDTLRLNNKAFKAQTDPFYDPNNAKTIPKLSFIAPLKTAFSTASGMIPFNSSLQVTLTREDAKKILFCGPTTESLKEGWVLPSDTTYYVRLHSLDILIRTLMLSDPIYLAFRKEFANNKGAKILYYKENVSVFPLLKNVQSWLSPQINTVENPILTFAVFQPAKTHLGSYDTNIGIFNKPPNLTRATLLMNSKEPENLIVTPLANFSTGLTELLYFRLLQDTDAYNSGRSFPMSKTYFEKWGFILSLNCTVAASGSLLPVIQTGPIHMSLDFSSALDDSWYVTFVSLELALLSVVAGEIAKLSAPLM